MNLQLYRSASPKPSMVRVDGPEDGQWCNFNDVCRWIKSFAVEGGGDELIVRFPRAVADEITREQR